MKKVIMYISILFIGCQNNGSDASTQNLLENNITIVNLQLTPETTWYWQLKGNLNMEYHAKVYDIDLFNSSKELIDRLHKRGKVVICYFSAGSYEDWRWDKDRFHIEELGEKLESWRDERWLDIRSENIKQIMVDRLTLAKKRGCDGVEADNVDGYINGTGFTLTYNNQIEFNRFLANNAHKLGLLIGLKNDIEQIDDLVSYFDFAINEECHEYNECNNLIPFLKQNKPVFNVEYAERYFDSKEFERLCRDSLNLRTLFLPMELDGTFIKSCD